MIPSTLLGLILTLGPYTGPPLSGSVPDTAKFAVDVRGTAGQHVHLRTIGVPSGYIASFCTNVVCAPFSVSFALPASGHERIELQLIPNDPGARKPQRVVVGANDRVRASIAFSRAAH